MVYDLKISGGLVVDGTGHPGRRMDVGIVGDRSVAVGDLKEAAHQEIDATDRVVIPGFVDISPANIAKRPTLVIASHFSIAII